MLEKDSDYDSDKENDDFQRRNRPKLVDNIRRSDEVADGVDDDCG